MMFLTDGITDYLRFILHERGLSKNNPKGYHAQLAHYTRWLEENGYRMPTAECLNLPVLRRFLYHLSGKELKARTIHSYFDPHCGLCLFLVSNGILKENPVKSLTLPKKGAAQRLTVSNEEIAQLLIAVERDRNPRRLALNRAVLNVLIFGGLRRAELCDLHLDDVNLKSRSVLIREGKGSKSRTIYLPEAATATIREYIHYRPKDCKHPFLFAVDRQRRLWFNGVQGLLEDVKMAAGLADRHNIKPHALRHWRATDLLRAGADLKSISAFLGHNQLATTSIYLHTSEEQCRTVSEMTKDDGKVIDLRDRQQDRERHSHRIARQA